MNQTTPSVTSGQKRDIRRLFDDALDGAHLDRDAAQKVLGRGGRLKSGIIQLLDRPYSLPLLRLATTVDTPAIATCRARDMPGEHLDGFRSAFLSGDGKVETEVEKATLRGRELQVPLTDASIIAELGGMEAAETSLSQMSELMMMQHQGKQGILLYIGYNIFYARDASKTLCAVSCHTYSGHDFWRVDAFPVARGLHVWCAGSWVFSR